MSPGDASDAPETARPGLVLAATILASSLSFIDGSVVNVGLPAIGRSLGAPPSDLPWVVNAYLLPLGALLLLGGAAGDRFGRRLVLVGGTTVFAAASMACTLAPSLPCLLAGRVAQGVGAAMLMPNSLSILGTSFAGARRGRAIGLWAASGAAMGAAGPVLGGWLVDEAGWRTIFALNLPLAAGAIALALVGVHESRRQGHVPLDVAGAALATCGLAALTWALSIGAGPAGWSRATGVALAAGVALLGAFIAVERHRGARAMMPLALFGGRVFVGLTLLTLLLYGALGVLAVLVPYVLIEKAGYSATASGAALLPLPLVLAAASPTMGALAGRLGPRLPLTVGPTIVALGFLLLLRIERGYWSGACPALLTIAVGLAVAVAPLTTAVLGSVEPDRTGVASGFNNAVARIGGMIATALLGGVLAAGGAALLAGFQTAVILSAAACLAAALVAVYLVR